jgi:signal peptidase
MRKLVISQAELAVLSNEVLRQGGCFCFHAKGQSMWPFLRDGDMITVQSVAPEDLGVRDIVLFLRANSNPVVHRIVGKALENAGLVFRTQGDTLFGPAEIVHSDRVLGKAIAFARNGRTHCLDSWPYRIAAYLWYKFRVLARPILVLRRVYRRMASRTLTAIQERSLYRHIAGKLVSRWINCRFLVPDDADELSRIYPREANLRRMLESLGKDNFVIGTTLGSRLTGAVTLSFLDEGTHPGSDRLLSGLYVRCRFRGLGIGERLVQKALELARQQNAKRIECLVFEDNKLALCLYRKMGFQPLACEIQLMARNRRRIIISREI